MREMWRAAASLELLPIGTKTELGDALVKRVKAGDFKESELWCLSRLGARKLFYGPINLVVPPATADALGGSAAQGRRPPATPWPPWPAAPRTPRAICPPPRAKPCARKLESMPHAERLLAVLEGEEEDDRALGRIFGEELPSGLVLAEKSPDQEAP